MRKIFKRKLKKKQIVFSTVIFFIMLLYLFPTPFLADFGDILASGVAKLIVVIGSGVEVLLGAGDSGLNIDMAKLVYNVDKLDAATNIKDLNLTLLRTNSLSTGIMTIYNLSFFIAISLLAFSGLIFTIDFIKTADNPQHKKELISKLKKLAISILLLANVNLIIETLLVINQVILDSFRLLITTTLKTNIKVDGPFLMSTFKELADPKGVGNGSIPMAIAYLGCGILNIWLVVVYMIRDLTIAYLYIFAPIMIIFIPHKLDLFLKWFKEMGSNIFTQAVHGLILMIIIATTSALEGGKATFYDQIFALVSFAMFIPLTGMIKKLLGLEGEFGAAKSTAGVAGVMGAVALTGAVAGMAKKAGTVGTSIGDYKNASSELEGFQKGSNGGSVKSDNSSTGGSSIGGNGMEPISNSSASVGRITDGIDRSINTPMTNDLKSDKNEHYNATSIGNQLIGQKKMARRKLVSSVVGAAGSISGGMNLGVGMAMLNPMAGGMGAKMGSEMGEEVGEIVGKGANDGYNVSKDYVDDKMNGEGIRFDGVQRDPVSATEGINLSAGMESMSFDSTDIGGTIKSNMGVIKNNAGQLKQNVEKGLINYKANRKSKSNAREQVKENLSAEHDAMFGIDRSNLSEQNYRKEVKANLNRQKQEQRGNFDKASRNYANKTYDRNTNPFDIIDESYQHKKDTSSDKDSMYENMFNDLEMLGDTDNSISEMENMLTGKQADLFRMYNSSQLS